MSLNHGVVDAKIKRNDGSTALIEPGEFGGEEMIRALLKHKGVDVNVHDTHGDIAVI